MSDATHYVPPKNPEPLLIRQRPRGLGKRLSKRAIIILVTLLLLGLLVAIVNPFSSGETPKDDYQRAQFRAPMPNEVVSGLANDYGYRREVPKKLGPPLHGEIGATELAFQRSVKEQTHELSPEEKLLLEVKLQHLRRALLARDSDVEFSGPQISQVKTVSSPDPRTQELLSQEQLLSQKKEGLGEGASRNARDDANRQDDKSSFLSASHSNDPYLHANLLSPLSPFELKAGTIIPGVLLTGINSDLPGQIVGQVSQNVFNTVSGRSLLLPQGTKIIGEYDSRISYGQERVLVVWTRLIMPNGKSISLEGMPGIDLSGYAGLSDKVNNHYLRLLTGVVFGSILGAGAQVAQGQNKTFDPSFSQLAVQGAAENINEAGQQITRKNLNVQPTLEISPGFQFNVFVTKDIVLEPYSA